jgi:hypothetical protein
MADNIVEGLFGLSPQQVWSNEQKQINQDAYSFGQQDAMSRGLEATARGARGLGGMLAGPSAEMQQAQMRQQVLGGADVSTPEGLRALGAKFNAMGDPQRALALTLKAQELDKAIAEEKWKLAQAAKLEKDDQFKNLPPEVQARLKLASLPPDSAEAKALQAWLDANVKKDNTWSEPFQLGGATVQKNSATGEIRTAVSRPPVTHISTGSVKKPPGLTREAGLIWELKNGYLDQAAYDAAIASKGTPTTADDAVKAGKILALAGYDPASGEDKVSKLIEESTSGGIASAGANIAGAFGLATTGAKAINRLSAMSSKLALDLMGGKLGAGVSNADRDFIVAQLGSISDPKLPKESRLAAWHDVRDRMISVGLIQPKAGQPAPAPAPAPAPVAPPAQTPRKFTVIRRTAP